MIGAQTGLVLRYAEKKADNEAKAEEVTVDQTIERKENACLTRRPATLGLRKEPPCKIRSFGVMASARRGFSFADISLLLPMLGQQRSFVVEAHTRFHQTGYGQFGSIGPTNQAQCTVFRKWIYMLLPLVWCHRQSLALASGH